MKKYIKTAIVLTSLLLALCSCNSARAKNEGYDLYRSSPVGVEIEYPDFWEVVDDKEERTVAFAAPNEGYADTYRDNVSICSVETGEEAMAFDNYVTSYIEQLPSTINDFNKITENDMTVSGLEAYRIVYEGSTDEGALRLQQTFIKSGNYTYIYSFIAEPESYDYFAQNSDVMLSTFNPLRK